MQELLLVRLLMAVTGIVRMVVLLLERQEDNDPPCFALYTQQRTKIKFHLWETL